GPVDSYSLLLIGSKVQITPPIALTPPNQRSPPCLVSPNPIKGGFLDIRMLAVSDKKLAISLVGQQRLNGIFLTIGRRITPTIWHIPGIRHRCIIILDMFYMPTAIQ